MSGIYFEISARLARDLSHRRMACEARNGTLVENQELASGFCTCLDRTLGSVFYIHRDTGLKLVPALN